MISFPIRVKQPSIPHNIQMVTMPHPISQAVGTGLSPEVNRPEREAVKEI
jgi:hypothetical protein